MSVRASFLVDVANGALQHITQKVQKSAHIIRGMKISNL